MISGGHGSCGKHSTSIVDRLWSKLTVPAIELRSESLKLLDSSLTSGPSYETDAPVQNECMDRPQRIGLFGLFGTGNFGNDASLEAVLSSLRKARPDAEYICICGSPDRVSSEFSINTVDINWQPKSKTVAKFSRSLFDVPRAIGSLFQALRYCRKLDTLIIPGTGILDDFSTGPRGMPLWIFRWCVLARLCGARVLFLNVGAGPISHPVSRWLMLKAAKQADYRSYRDEISRKFMANLGCDVGRDPVYPDVAFSLPDPNAPSKQNSNDDRLRVGIGVMSYNGWRGDKASDKNLYNIYMRKLQRFVGWLIDQGHEVQIVIGDEIDASAANDLWSSVRAEYGARAESAVRVKRAHCLDDVKDQMASTDVVVATRFHNIVCALSLGRPVISIGYAKKNDVLTARAGLGDFCQHIDNLDEELLKKQFTSLVENRAFYEQKVMKLRQSFAQQLDEQSDMVLEAYL